MSCPRARLKLGTPFEVEVVRNEQIALAGSLGLPDIGLCTEGGEPLGQDSLQPHLITRRFARLARSSIAGNELADEIEQFIAAGANALRDVLLQQLLGSQSTVQPPAEIGACAMAPGARPKSLSGLS